MRRLTGQPLDDEYDPSGTHTCPECGARYSGTGGGHCRGGRYGGCCRTFTSDTAAAAHRRGPGDARRCITDAEMADDGWRSTGNGWTNSAPMPEGIHESHPGDTPAP